MHKFGIFKCLCLWSATVPSKVTVFSWKVVLDRVQTRLQFRKRKLLRHFDDISCPFCKQHVETANHLLFLCQVSHYVWMRGCNWLELDIVLPNEVIAHFWQHAGLIAGTKSKKGHGVRCGWRLRGLYGPTEMI